MNQNVIYELLQDRAKCAPNATAVIDEQRSLTRMELEQLIDTIAVKIPSGAGRVGIMMEHTVEIYILYTSGSTGAPKGVAVRNRNVCHYVRAFQNEFHTNEDDMMLQYSVC